MSPERLLGLFEPISEAPDAIVRMRQLVLDLAVRGKLVDPKSTDEPASKLIEQIEAARCHAVKRGGLKPFEAAKPNELPISLPPRWEVRRLGWLAAKLGAGSTPLGGKSVYVTSGVPFLRSQNIYDEGVRLDGVARIPRATHERMSGTHVHSQDILLNITGASIGRCALVPDTLHEANVSQHVAIVRLLFPGIRQFIHLCLRSPLYQRMIDAVQVGVSREGLSMQSLRLFPMVLPPIPEQNRIVERVNELMDLCDQLEAAQTEREARRDRLACASLHYLNYSANTEDCREHARFYINQLPRLITRPEQINHLRQTILNLAVRGKLVMQNVTDEPAQDLLCRIQAEKRRLAQIGVIRIRSSAPPETNSPVFELPSTWAWAEWNTVAKHIGDIDHKMPESVDEGIPYVSPSDFLPRNGIDYDGAKRVSTADYLRLSRKVVASRGDLIYPRYGTIGETRLVEVDRDFLVSYSCAVIKVLPGFISPQYQWVYSRSDCCKSQAAKAENKTTQPNVGIKSIQGFSIPIPPKQEQDRIVAKVNELMAICDQLERSLTKAQTERSRLLESVLHETLNSAAAQTA